MTHSSVQSSANTAVNTVRTEDLVRLYYAYLLRLVQSIVHDAQEAEDLVQETFISAMLTINKEAKSINYKAWLSKIAVNKARDQLRRRTVRQKWQQVMRLNLRGEQRSQLPEEIASKNEETQALWLAVEALAEKHRVPIILRYGHGLPIREIAHLLDIKEGTVHSRLHYAQKQLAQQLKLDVNRLFLSTGAS